MREDLEERFVLAVEQIADALKGVLAMQSRSPEQTEDEMELQRLANEEQIYAMRRRAAQRAFDPPPEEEARINALHAEYMRASVLHEREAYVKRGLIDPSDEDLRFMSRRTTEGRAR